jgi:hypothetical protein
MGGAEELWLLKCDAMLLDTERIEIMEDAIVDEFL